MRRGGDGRPEAFRINFMEQFSVNTYSVTYIGDSPVVEICGYRLERKIPCESVNGENKALIKRLKNNRFFVVEQLSGEPEDETVSQKPFPTDSKGALEAWAKDPENLGIDLDKRKSLKKLIADVEAALAEKERGSTNA